MKIKTRLDSGFTLIELLVVIAIIGILLPGLLPPVQQDRHRRNEMRAEAILKTICVAQTAFARTDPDGDGQPDYARSVRELAHFGLIDPGFLRRKEAAGYRFDVHGSLDARGAAFDWYGTAVPVYAEKTGCGSFHIDRDDVIRETRREDCALADLFVLARTILESLNLDGAVEGAMGFLETDDNVEAILDVLDANGDGAYSSEEMFGLDVLVAARAVLDGTAPGEDRGEPIGDDQALREAAAALLGFVEKSLDAGAGGEGGLPAVPRDSLSVDALAFLALPPAEPAP